MNHINQHKKKLGLADAEAELVLFSAEEDDYGVTMVLMDQVYDGIPVFGGRLVIHTGAEGQPLDFGEARDDLKVTTGTSIDNPTAGLDKKVPGVVASIYKEARQVNTTPKLTPSQAIESAKTALGYAGSFADTPKAELLILPHQVRKEGPEDASGGATLVYRVELLVEDGTAATARWWYFINAHDGSVVWRYDGMERGVGQSLYSGVVNFPSGYWDFYTSSYNQYCGGYYWDAGYYLWDGSSNYGYMESIDMKNQQNPDPAYLAGSFYPHDRDDTWGIYANCPLMAQKEQAGVDTQFGMALTWDYFLTFHGWRGIDNAGYRMFSRVHYGTNLDLAGWNGRNLTFGDGSAGRPWVSIDTVGHEWTHV